MNVGRRAAERRAVAALTAGLDIEEAIVAGRHGPIPIRRYRRMGPRPTRILVWAHGGSFSHGGRDQHDEPDDGPGRPGRLPRRRRHPVGIDLRAGSRLRGQCPALLTAGHWYPVCVVDVDGYPEQAQRIAFLAQVINAAVPAGGDGGRVVVGPSSG